MNALVRVACCTIALGLCWRRRSNRLLSTLSWAFVLARAPIHGELPACDRRRSARDADGARGAGAIHPVSSSPALHPCSATADVTTTTLFSRSPSCPLLGRACVCEPGHKTAARPLFLPSRPAVRSLDPYCAVPRETNRAHDLCRPREHHPREHHPPTGAHATSVKSARSDAFVVASSSPHPYRVPAPLATEEDVARAGRRLVDRGPPS